LDPPLDGVGRAEAAALGAQFRNVRLAALRRKDRRRPLVSATTPVGISNSTMPAVKAALATNTWKVSRPASNRNSVLTPQITEAESVNNPEMAR
jgi:hypothetical protein